MIFDCANSNVNTCGTIFKQRLLSFFSFAFALPLEYTDRRSSSAPIAVARPVKKQ
jgi:hypothetical protein